MPEYIILEWFLTRILVKNELDGPPSIDLPDMRIRPCDTEVLKKSGWSCKG